MWCLQCVARTCCCIRISARILNHPHKRCSHSLPMRSCLLRQDVHLSPALVVKVVLVGRCASDPLLLFTCIALGRVVKKSIIETDNPYQRHPNRPPKENAQVRPRQGQATQHAIQSYYIPAVSRNNRCTKLAQQDAGAKCLRTSFFHAKIIARKAGARKAVHHKIDARKTLGRGAGAVTISLQAIGARN